jgi:hypothetical protein
MFYTDIPLYRAYTDMKLRSMAIITFPIEHSAYYVRLSPTFITETTS